MTRMLQFVVLVAMGVLSLGCGDSTGTGGAAGTGTGGGGGATGGTGGVANPPFEGFAIVPPPSGDEFKEKQSFEDRLAETLVAAEVPSAFAGAFVQLSRSYLSGREPGSPLEEANFAIFDALAQSTKDAMGRVVAGIDALPAEDSARLYGEGFVNANASEILTAATLTDKFASELRSRVSVGLFAEPDPSVCLDGERPGLPRVALCPDIDVDFDGFCNAMCRINTDTLVFPIRTSGHIPLVSAAALLPTEVEQACTVDGGGGPLLCSNVMSPNCKGDPVSGSSICRAVPLVLQGGSVTLRGFNFFDVDARVRLALTTNLANVTEVQGHVCGDVRAGANAALDCDSINDRITFTVPSNLAAGLYRITVEVPNNTGDPTYDRSVYFSRQGHPIIQVVPPLNTEFELISEELLCIDETGADFLGSDEVGISVITTRLSNDGSFDPIASVVKFEFGNVDSGNRRRLDRRHFIGTLQNQTVAVAIVGYEIDNREAFEQEINTFADAYVAVLKTNWGIFAAAAGTTAGGIATLFGGPVVGTAVAAGLTFAINSIVALWAPADLIIEDASAISFLPMAERTNLNFPNPPIQEYESSRGIDVTAAPCEDTEDRDRPECEASAKAPQQYRERREYNGGNRGSDYQITLRYRRTN